MPCNTPRQLIAYSVMVAVMGMAALAPFLVTSTESSGTTVQLVKSCRSSDESSGAITVMVLVGTRPEVVKMAPVVKELQKRPGTLRPIVVSTGQHKQMVDDLLGVFGMAGAVNVSLDLMQEDQTLPSLTARVVTKMGEVLTTYCPDILLVQGDTTSAFIGALTAFYFKVPVGHVEAGLRTRNIYSPFPEEVNRQGIGLIASLHFAATSISGDNLMNEFKDGSMVFVTGNTVVDSLQQFSNAQQASPVLKSIDLALSQRCGQQRCRLVLLTAHRRENHGQPLQDIVQAVERLLQAFPDVLVLYPVHMNPNVRNSIQQSVPTNVFASLQSNSRALVYSHAQPLSRLMLVPPLQYPDLIMVMNRSEVIMTDSGGIQEEGAVLGKPILVLRNNTERPEGVMAGVARLVGTNPDTVFGAAALLLNGSHHANVAGIARTLYGDGTAGAKIVDLIQWYFTDRSKAPPLPSLLKQAPFDIVIVVTIWKRETLDAYMEMLTTQSIFTEKGMRGEVLAFQNGDHINISKSLEHWQGYLHGLPNIKLTHVHSKIQTGYYGRFIAPLLSFVQKDGYFIVCDDDVIFGKRYLENMLRVVDAGMLATRNGRFIPSGGGRAHAGSSSRGWREGWQVTFETDVQYDFGGQLWAGRFEWIRLVWSHPPPTLITAEDFWISAVLNARYNVLTARPRCPRDDVEKCACSMKVADKHHPVEVGNVKGGDNRRVEAEGAIAAMLDFTRIGNSYEGAEKAAYTYYEPGTGPFNTTGTAFEKCLYWN